MHHALQYVHFDIEVGPLADQVEPGPARESARENRDVTTSHIARRLRNEEELIVPAQRCAACACVARSVARCHVRSPTPSALSPMPVPRLCAPVRQGHRQ